MQKVMNQLRHLSYAATVHALNQLELRNYVKL